MIADARAPRIRSDLPRSCRLDNGKQKMAFPTRRAARDYTRTMLGSKNYGIYRCDACDWYHLTTKVVAK